MRWIVGTLFLLACTRGPEASSDGSEPSPDVEVPPAPTLEAHVERFGPNASIATTDAGYDPTFDARRTRGRVTNPEAAVPPLCYTATGGASNPCWVCHTVGQSPNDLEDVELQQAYAFSDFARDNHWNNLFEPPAAPPIDDAALLAYVRADNYRALGVALTELAARGEYPGYVPDLDLEAGFDDEGFARDGSGWRALRYQPFAGTFWPTNGSTDDVFVRLPEAFRRDRATYRANLAILEAAIASDPRLRDADVEREVEPIDERAIELDLDRDGTLGVATSVRGLPSHYVGTDHPVRRRVFPEGTELLHSVRYLDPDAPSGMARRMKELRYMRKIEEYDDWRIHAAYAEELDEKERGKLPRYEGSAMVGLISFLGWQLQGFLEDAEGRLRAQTDEEHRVCVGCHQGIGVLVDGTFSFARKVPGAEGWRPQDLRGLSDRPQVGHAEGEVLTYLRRVRAGDELRANGEMIERFFDAQGRVRADEVRRAAPGGDRDLAWLLMPSRQRALALDRAYLGLVRAQRFHLGRDAVLAPPTNVHRRIENEATELEQVHFDGRLHLEWR
ncbi:MAG: hypothetical protein H6722_16350 [Sandaracinus sp.]|nr:hypothetical protein [Sandaracinus sp.]